MFSGEDLVCYSCAARYCIGQEPDGTETPYKKRRFAARAQTLVLVLFLFLIPAVGDFRAEFCDKPIARKSCPFGLILRLLIRRAVYCNPFFKRRKRSKSHEAMGVQSLGPRGETPFFIWRFRAIRLLPDTTPSTTEISYKILSREKTRRKKFDVVCRGRFPS